MAGLLLRQQTVMDMTAPGDYRGPVVSVLHVMAIIGGHRRWAPNVGYNG